MEILRRIALFLLCLIVLGLFTVFLSIIFKIHIRQKLDMLRLKLQLRHAVREMAEIQPGQTITPLTEYEPQDDGGMVVLTYRNGRPVKEVCYTGEEWARQKALHPELLKRPNNNI